MCNESENYKQSVSDSKDLKKSQNRNWQGEWRRTPGRILGTSLIRFYQLTFSSMVGYGCRHLPTCSEYGYEAIARYGLLKGGWLTLLRVAKCGPWGTSGHDPVPTPKNSKKISNEK
jgi:putative membrane protein insertion efficiency factor